MNKVIIFVIIITIVTSCSSRQFSLDSHVVRSGAAKSMILIPTGALVESCDTIVNDTEFKIGILDNKIVFVSTDDSKFSIDGYRINSTLPTGFFKNKLGYAPGWGYYAELDSGWYAGFDFSKKPTEETPIKFFFKFDF